MSEQIFSKIAGFDKIKKELKVILNWFQRKTELKKVEVKLPKGIVFYGVPGVGKTLFMREYSKAFNYPIFVFEGSSDDLSKELMETFEKAKKEKNAIIVIDEIDLLIKNNSTIQRLLQTEMDGFNEAGDILVLATANNTMVFSEALKRPGRFDRLILIGNPDTDTRKEIFKMYLNNLKVDCSNINLDFLAAITVRLNCVEIQTIVNDAYLRSEGKALTTEMLEESYYLIYYQEIFDYEKDNSLNKATAYHEIGHAILVYKYRKNFSFYRATLQTSSIGRGACKYYPINENDDSLVKLLQQIEIALAGHLTTKMLLNYESEGSVSDLRKTNYIARALVSGCGYKGIGYVLKEYSTVERNETWANAHRNEKLVRKILLKCEKRVKLYIKKNKKKIIQLSEALYSKGTINNNELLEIMEKKGA